MASTNESADLDRLVHRFDEAWRRGEQPTIWTYLEEGGNQTSVLVELIYIELKHRLEAGETARVEDYLQRFPALMKDSAFLLDLLGSEYQLRRRRDKSVSQAEYLQRFPGFRNEIPIALAAPGRLDETIIILKDDARDASAVKEQSHIATPVAEQSRAATPVSQPSCVAAAVGGEDHSPSAVNEENHPVTPPIDQSYAVTTAPKQDNTVIEPSLSAMVSKSQEQAETLFHSDSNSDGTQQPAAPKTNVPGYEVLGELGRGGMGVVYKARQVGLKRLVALKMIISGQHAGQKDLARFQSEAELIAKLHNPNIVQIYDINQHEGFPYFALEYIDGGTLADKVAGKPMEPQQAAEMMRAVALAVHSAHKEGVVHRDLKPDNILLTKDGVPKITDFGLAKHMERSSIQTQTGTVMGTPGYMAPEQALGKSKEVGTHSDIYSLGAILYEMLTGRPPFKGETPVDTMLMVVSEEPAPVSTVVPGVPRDIETICLKCLQKEIHHRYPTAQEFADELGRFLSGDPILARPITRIQRAVRWGRRNSTMVAVGSLLATVFLVLSGALVYKIKNPPAAPPRIVNIDGQQVEVPDEPEIKRDTSMERLVTEGNKFDEVLDRDKLDAIRKTLTEVAAQTDPPPAPASLAYLKVLEALVRAHSDDAAARTEALGQIKELLGQTDVQRPDRLCQAVMLLAHAQPPVLSVRDAIAILHKAVQRENLSPAGQARIQDYLRGLQTEQVKADAIKHPATWSELLAACKDADSNDSWVRAAQAEALLETAGAKPSPQVLNEAGNALSIKTLKEAGDYAAYVQALWYDASDEPIKAADALLQAFRKTTLDEALRVTDRQKRAVQILAKSAERRRAAADSSNPFQPPLPPETLTSVYATLKTAYDLSNKAQLPTDNALLCNLALAAWYKKEPRDDKLAAELLPQLKTDNLKPDQALAIQVLKVQVNQDDPKHRNDALIGYARLLPQLREYFKAKDVTWSATDWYKRIIEPGIAVADKLQISEKSPYEERQALARLYIEKGMLIGQDATLVASEPYEQMKEANDRALKLDDKLEPFDRATCLFQRDISLMWLRKVDLKQFEADAAEMQKLDPEYAGARYLRGWVRSAEARDAGRKQDWDGARAKRAEANQEYSQAIELLKKKDPYNELPVYFMERCNNWYEWSYLEPAKRVQYLDEAIKDAKSAIQHKPLHVDYAYAFLGNAYEDLAWYTGNAEPYAQAASAFREARRKDLGRSKYWISLARCNFRVVANARPSDPIYKTSLQEGIGLLERVRDDEQKGQRKLTPEEKAEANLFLGKLYELDNKVAAAAKAFEAVEALKAEPGTAVWVQMALEGGAEALLKQAGASGDASSADFKKAVAKAREQAQTLAGQPGKARIAARLLGSAAQLEGKPADALQEYQKAIEKEPLQADEASMRLGQDKLNLLLDERWKVDLRGKNLPGTDPESVAAQADALATLSDRVPIYRGRVYGLAGLAHLEAANPDDAKQQQSQREAALAKLREAVKSTLPDAPDGWRWRLELARVLRDLAKGDNSKAYKDEALKALGEAEKLVPSDRKMELQTLKKELQS